MTFKDMVVDMLIEKGKIRKEAEVIVHGCVRNTTHPLNGQWENSTFNYSEEYVSNCINRTLDLILNPLEKAI